MKPTERAWPHVDVVVVNWNNAADTLATVASLQKIEYPTWTVWVVDNGSHADEAAALRQGLPPSVRYIETGANLGFAGGNNVALREISSSRGYALLLNNDTLVDPSFLGRLVERAEENPRIGLVGPKTYYENADGRRDVVWTAGGTFSWLTCRPKNRGDREPDHGQFDAAQKVQFLPGACVLLTPAMLAQRPLLEERYFLQWEDLDLCIQAAEIGLESWYEPAAIIWHKVSASYKKGGLTVTQSYYSTRNKLLFLQRRAPRWARAYHTAVLLGLEIPMRSLLARNRDARRALWRGAKDGLRGRGGIAPR